MQTRVVDSLIHMKVAQKLSEKQMQQVIQNCVGEDAELITELVRQELKNNGYHAHRLHGCTTCEDFIWLHSENISCPNCNDTEGRYDGEGNALQEVFYFELLPRLEQMYSNVAWRQTLCYPNQRPVRRRARSDVFDGTEYKRLRRAAGQCDHFISFAHVADAVSSNKKMSRSVLPGILRLVNDCNIVYMHCAYVCVCVYYVCACVYYVYVCVCACACVCVHVHVCAYVCISLYVPVHVLYSYVCIYVYMYICTCVHSINTALITHSVLNYDPRLRYHKNRNLLLTFLMPPKISTRAAQKFYRLLEEELNVLFYQGIAGGKLKGALVMTRADQKGKEFDLGLRSCTSYDGPCSVCEIMAYPGAGPFTKTNVGEYRRFLPPDHPYRRDPSFGPIELQAAPAYRNKARSDVGVAIAKDAQIELPYYQVVN